MKLKNMMEEAVRNQLAKMQKDLAGDDAVCWCQLCRADMIALSLSTLPPRYGTKLRASVAHEHAAAVREAVSSAIRQVGRFPKHPRGEGVPATESVWVVNFPLEESFHAVDSRVNPKHACDCWQCRCDMVAFALNRYPARYGVERGGRTHLFPDDREQMRRELSGFLDLAARLVTEVPRHERVAAAS